MTEAQKKMMKAQGVKSLTKEEPSLEEQLADLAEYVDVLTAMLIGGMDDGD